MRCAAGGVCQDFAELMIGCLRSIGLARALHDGYILTHPRAGKPRIIGADASHAWVLVFARRWGEQISIRIITA